MAQGQGYKGFIGVTTESVWGTYVSPSTTNFNRVKTIAVKPRGAQTSGNKNLGVAWASQQRVHQKKSQGQITLDMSYQGYERLLLHLFGSKATTGPTDTSAYTHVFTPSITRQVGLSLSVEADLLEMRYPGSKITRGRFNFRKNDPLELALDFIGLPNTVDPPGTAVTGNTFLEDAAAGNSCVNPIEATSGSGFKFYLGTAGGSGYSEVGVVEGDLTIDVPHVEDRGNVGVATIAEPTPNGSPIMSINGTLKKEFLDNSFILPFIQGIQKAFKFTYKSNSFIGSSVYWELTIEAKYVRFLESPPEISGPGPIEDTIPFICESPDGSTAPVTLTLINKLSSIS